MYIFNKITLYQQKFPSIYNDYYQKTPIAYRCILRNLSYLLDTKIYEPYNAG